MTGPYLLTYWKRWYVDAKGLLQRRPEYPTDDSVRYRPKDEETEEG